MGITLSLRKKVCEKYIITSANERWTQEQVVKYIQTHETMKSVSAVEIEHLIGIYQYWIKETVPLSKVKPKRSVGRNPEGSGSKGPIVVDKKYVIQDGNHRYYDAEDDGVTEIEILRPGPYVK